MPGPNGTYSAYKVQHMPANANLLTGSRGPTIEKPQKYLFGKGIVSGTAAGASSGGWIGAAIGAGVGLIGDIIGWRQSKKAQEQAQDFNKVEADRAYGRSLASEREAAAYNSEAAQVQRMKAAGLSPALAYQQMGPSTMSGVSASPASSPAAPVADFNADGLGVANAAIQARAVDATAKLQATEGAKMDVERLQLEIDNLTRHQSNISAIDAQLSQKGLNEATTARLNALRDLEVQQLLETINNISSSTKKIDAESAFIAGPQTQKVYSDISLNKSTIELQGSQVALSETQRKKLNSEIDTIDFNLDNDYDFRDAVKDLLVEHDIDPRYWKYVTEFLSDVGPRVVSQTSETLLSWFKADNWINLFSRWISSKNIGKSNSYEHIMQDVEKKK